MCQVGPRLLSFDLCSTCGSWSWKVEGCRGELNLPLLFDSDFKTDSLSPIAVDISLNSLPPSLLAPLASFLLLSYFVVSTYSFSRNRYASLTTVIDCDSNRETLLHSRERERETPRRGREKNEEMNSRTRTKSARKEGIYNRYEGG